LISRAKNERCVSTLKACNLFSLNRDTNHGLPRRGWSEQLGRYIRLNMCSSIYFQALRLRNRALLCSCPTLRLVQYDHLPILPVIPSGWTRQTRRRSAFGQRERAPDSSCGGRVHKGSAATHKINTSRRTSSVIPWERTETFDPARGVTT